MLTPLSSWQPLEVVPRGWAVGEVPHAHYPIVSFLDPATQTKLGDSVLPRGDKMAVTSSMIDMCLLVPETMYGLIQNHPEVIKDTGFNGQTLLHRAVLSAQPEVVQILLEYLVDPNTPNHHDETPLHFACKRGNPFVIHALVGAGADLSAVDKSGKTMVHHATQGGSVPSLHYLWEVHDMSLRVADKDGNTPLHIACQHGHPDLLSYLLKKERSDLEQTNASGDTALHVAARLGHSLLCWKLLEKGCVRLLQQANKQGCTPIDIVQQCDQVRYRPTQKILEHYGRHTRGGRLVAAEGPGWVWWLLLGLPFLMYSTTVTLTVCIENHAGGIMLVGMVVILSVCAQQGHRMKHISGWPNPMFMGMFGAGLSHTIIACYFKLLPILLERNQLTAYLYVCQGCVMIYMYYRLLTKNPGVVTAPDRKPSGEWYTILDVATGVKPIDAFCKSCEIMQPPRTKHCKLCERCFVDMDHHCLFLYRCVARHTHGLFCRFILIVMLAQCLFEYHSCRLIVAQYTDDQGLFGISFWGVFYYEPWIWSLMLANLASILWGYTLLYFQLSVVSKGHTTYFQPNFGSTSLGRLQRFMNMVYFLLGRKAYAVDPKMKRYCADRH